MSTLPAEIRSPVVAGTFYPAGEGDLRALVESFLSEVEVESNPSRFRGVLAPHAGLVYSGRCAAEVFGRVRIPPVVVVLAPNHTGRCEAPGGASLWARGAFRLPVGELAVAEEFAAELMSRSDLVADDREAHRGEHAVEVELPFIALLRPEASIVPLVLAWTDWERCRRLAESLAGLVANWPEPVLLVASSDMTHFESAESAAVKDRAALSALERLDGRELLAACSKDRITMCGRGPAAVVAEAARRLGATRGTVVDYRHSGWVTGDDSSVVAYAGMVMS